ncbi:MAG TPA: hypothetical protein VNW53_06510 [Phenylobacterium sp.]|jgi:hypothetical protein|uniref:hypothetical protein n=1 Tax=Phenylobacterium sp. TaxID=1871053 RepID=UPI002C20DB62|nr:hypothetical protein [Phenylobacterium sp.]HXA38635.1 hypothetical protein [Phenylobacterium sp.]
MSQPPDDHIKALWQGQETETPIMTLQAVRALARNHSNHQRDILTLVAGLAAAMVVPITWAAWRAPNNAIRIGELLDLVGVGWMLWRVRDYWPERMPGAEASVGALIDFHLSQLTRRRFSYRDALINGGPLIAGTVMILYGLHRAIPKAGLEKFAPIFGLLVVWAVLFLVVKRRGERRLQEQIEEVKALRGG